MQGVRPCPYWARAAHDRPMTFVPLAASAQSPDLEQLRSSILRQVASVARSVGVEEHELACDLRGDPGQLRVRFTGPQRLSAVRQALGVRVLDAVHADGRTFGAVEVELRVD